MIHSEEFISFNEKINPFVGSISTVTVFTDGRGGLAPEVKFLIYNEVRESPLSFYYSMFNRNIQLAEDIRLRFIFDECKFRLTAVQVLQELCRFKQECFGALPIFITLDLSFITADCATHSFIKGIKRAIAEVRRMNPYVKLLFILPKRSPLKINHDLWISCDENGLVKKRSDGQQLTFKCSEGAVNELMNSLVLRNSFNSLDTIDIDCLDIPDIPGLRSYISDISCKFDRYYEVV